MCARAREREREREEERVCVCVRACACVCERERVKEWERDLLPGQISGLVSLSRQLGGNAATAATTTTVAAAAAIARLGLQIARRATVRATLGTPLTQGVGGRVDRSEG